MHIADTSLELERVYTATLARQTRSLAVTSSNSGEGVSTLVQALARRNLLAGRSTLVLDLNLHRPSLDRAFELDRTAAEHDLLPPPQPVALAGAHGLARLGLVSAPLERHNIVPLREPGGLEAQIARFLEEYDSVIIDTSPVNMMNAGTLPGDRAAAACDATVFTVLAGRTTSTCVTSALERLGDAGAMVLGCVINDRDNPTLRQELLREVARLNNLAPRFTSWLRARVFASRLLALDV
jgi:Mrp family chromosome partitioning ATPase